MGIAGRVVTGGGVAVDVGGGGAACCGVRLIRIGAAARLSGENDAGDQ